LAAAAAAHAQDSVSASNGLPGDAPSAYQTTTGDTRQALRFSVDLAPKASSWASKYALGPVVKASRSNVSGFFDQLMGAQTASARFGSGAFFSALTYLQWIATPGAGVNPPQNTAPAFAIYGEGKYGQRFGMGFMEYGPGNDGAFGTGDDENTLIGSTVDFQFRQPNRLFVQRVVGAANKTTAAGLGTASMGLGAIDEQGNLHAYADGFGMTVASRLQTRALLRVKLGARGLSVVDQISGSGSSVVAADPGATDTIRAGVTMDTAPAIVSAGLAGGEGRPVLLASDLLGNYVYESAPNAASATTAYLSASATSPRGSICFIPQTYAPVAAANPVGTGATLARTDSNTKTRAVQVFGVAANGAIGTSTTVTLPTSGAALADPDDGFSPDGAFPPLAGHEFTNYAGPAAFRGGTSQVAMVRLPSGDLLVAGAVAANGGGSAIPQSQDGYIAVARLPAAGGTPAWTIAAHTGAQGFAGTGAGVASKAIYGRSSPAGALEPIGRLARYTEVFGSASTGPSISSPAIDLGGNVYFIATIGLTGTSTTFTTGLLRANFDGATNAYKLELLAAVGDVLPGLNSGKNYRIQLLGLAGTDGVDPGSIFSSAVVQDSIAGANAPAAGYGSAISLGALVFRAKIVYDMNADGVYADPSAGGTGATSPDQAYTVQMVLMPRVPKGDFNRDQALTVQDIFDFLAAWFTLGLGSDWNGSGATTVQDIFDFLTDWFAGG
jgi:hypothetical protein